MCKHLSWRPLSQLALPAASPAACSPHVLITRSALCSGVLTLGVTAGVPGASAHVLCPVVSKADLISCGPGSRGRAGNGCLLRNPFIQEAAVYWFKVRGRLRLFTLPPFPRSQTASFQALCPGDDAEGQPAFSRVRDWPIHPCGHSTINECKWCLLAPPTEDILCKRGNRGTTGFRSLQGD